MNKKMQREEPAAAKKAVQRAGMAGPRPAQANAGRELG